MGTVKEFITCFEQFPICTKDLSNEFYIEYFISGLKEVVQVHVRGHHPHNLLQAYERALESEVILNTQNPRSTFTSKSN